MGDNKHKDDINALIQAGEGQTIEFKDERTKPADLAETLVAFANADGGTVLIGVSDRQEVIGVTDTKEVIDRVHMAASRDCCDPPIRLDAVTCQNLGAKVVIVVEVRVSPTVHHTRGRFLQRVGSRNLALSPVALRELFASRDTAAEYLRPGREDLQAHLYEILWYDATLTLSDPAGHEALLERRQRIRFLQNGVVALYDHAWGDGKIFEGYRVTPGKVVDRFQVGHRFHTLIALRETKNRGDEMTYRVRRRILDGFLQPQEWLETEIDHPTAQLRLSVIFPKERPCVSVSIVRASDGHRLPLPQSAVKQGEDGRVTLTYSLDEPQLGERYAIHWRW